MLFPPYKMIAVSELAPYAANARTHSEAQIGQLVAAMKEWGFTNPLLVDERNGVIAGHARLAAAKRLGLEVVPAIVLAGLSEAQRRALVLADNKLALNAGWDDALLRIELADLRLEGFDLALTGFGELELADILADQTEGLTDPDAVSDVQDAAISRAGDVWVMGRHRLVCGDATNEIDVSLALAGVRPHLMVTDPPYGVSYDADWRNWRAREDGSPIRGRAIGKVSNDDRADWSEAWALFPGDVAYVWHAATRSAEVAGSLTAMDFDIRSQIVWVKQHFAIGRGDYHWQHEPCWYVVRQGKAGHYGGGRKQSTVWQIDKPLKSETWHSTQKPVECMRRPIENNSSPGQAVYEPFSGSGTTIIAAEMTGRACHAVEISPAYVDVAVRRWQAFSGQAAVLYGGDRTFADTEAERG